MTHSIRIALILTLTSATVVSQASLTVYTSLASWQAALTDVPVTNDFEGIAKPGSYYSVPAGGLDRGLVNFKLDASISNGVDFVFSDNYYFVGPAMLSAQGNGSSSGLNGTLVTLPSSRAAAFWIGDFGGNSQTFTFGTGDTFNQTGTAQGFTFIGFIASSAFTTVRVDEVDTDDPNMSMFSYGDVQPVPEPATMAALAIGAIGLIRRRRA